MKFLKAIIMSIKFFDRYPFLLVFIVYLVSIVCFAIYYQKAYQSNKDCFNIASSSLLDEIAKDNKNEKLAIYREYVKEHRDYLVKSIGLTKQIDTLQKFLNENVVYQNASDFYFNINRSVNSEIIDEPFELPFLTSYITANKFFSPVYKLNELSFKLSFKNDVYNQLSDDYLKYQCTIYNKKGDLLANENLKFNLKYLENSIKTEVLHDSLFRNYLGFLKEKKVKLNESDKVNGFISLRASQQAMLYDAKLNFWDFFYFSVITQSSTGYGDILPNNRVIRQVVSFQILLSIALLTFILGYLVDSKTKSK